MKTLKQNLLVTLALVVISITNATPSESKGTLLLDKETVVIKNDIPNANITIFCYSSEDDLGVHVLPYTANFTWYFKVNIGASTKFYCDFRTAYGSGTYGVFTKRLEDQCDDFCLWLIKDSGPCLQQTVRRGEPYCQSWKKPPLSISSSPSPYIT